MGWGSTECRRKGSIYKIANIYINFQTNSNMKPSLIIFLSITLLSTSCGHGGLSKKVAKDKIHQAEGYPLIIDYKFIKSFTKNENTTGYGVTLNVESDEFKLKKKMIEEFEKNGLLELKEEPYSEEGITLLGKTV